MKYSIEVTKTAAKTLKKIPKSDQKRIGEKIDALALELPDPGISKLKGNNPFHKARIGNYRIIYEIQNKIMVILIVKIGHRKDIYRNLT